MPTPQLLISGLDPTGQSNLNSSQYLQMIQQASPNTALGIGWMIFAAVAPSTATFPLAVLQNSIWVDTATADYSMNRFSAAPSTWVPIAIPTLGISSAAQIADGIITLIKLAIPGSSNNYVLRVNSNSTGLEWVAASSIIPNGSLPIAALNITGVTSAFLYVDAAGAISWASFDLVAMINALTNKLSVNILYNAGTADVGKILTSNGAAGNAWTTFASFLTAQSIPLTTLIAGVPQAGKTLVVGADGVVTFGSAIASTNTYRTAPANYAAVPTTTVAVTFAHGLTAQPDDFWFVLVCVNPEFGYVANDEVRFPLTNNGNFYIFCNMYADTNNISIVAYDWGGSGVIEVWKRSAPGTVGNITPANWRIKGYAVKYP